MSHSWLRRCNLLNYLIYPILLLRVSCRASEGGADRRGVGGSIRRQPSGIKAALVRRALADGNGSSPHKRKVSNFVVDNENCRLAVPQL